MLQSYHLKEGMGDEKKEDSRRSNLLPERMADEKKEDSRWSDLLPELLSLILSHVYYGDYYKFRAICTSWRSVTPPLRLTPQYLHYQSPCLLLHGKRRSHEFFNPVYNTIYQIDVPELSHAKIYSFNYGWFLMGSSDGNIFFLDPFTGVRIDIPAIPSHIIFGKMVFDPSPTSPNCSILGVEIFYGRSTFGVIKRGEENWTIVESDTLPKSWLYFHMCDCNPVFYDGQCYCLDIEGNLLVFNPDDVIGTWIVHGQSLPCKLRNTLRQRFIVKSDGEILAVFVYGGGQRRVWVSKFDVSKMVWKKVTDLGSRMLYLSSTSAFSAPSVIKGMGNKIYFPKFHGAHGVFYSLATNRYHSYGDDYSENSAPLKEVKEFTRATWIAPMFARCSSGDLKW